MHHWLREDGRPWRLIPNPGCAFCPQRRTTRAKLIEHHFWIPLTTVDWVRTPYRQPLTRNSFQDITSPRQPWGSARNCGGNWRLPRLSSSTKNRNCSREREHMEVVVLGGLRREVREEGLEVEQTLLIGVPARWTQKEVGLCLCFISYRFWETSNHNLME